MTTDSFSGLLTDPNFWVTLATIVSAIFFAIPGGVIQQLITALVNALMGLLQGKIPAQQYLKVKAFALDAVRAAYQKGEGAGLGNEDRKAYALQTLTSIVRAHGIKRFDATALDGMIEAAWSNLKPMLVEDGLLPNNLVAVQGPSVNNGTPAQVVVATQTTPTTPTTPTSSAGTSQPAISATEAAPLAASSAPADAPANATSSAATATPSASPAPTSVSPDASAAASNTTAALLNGASASAQG